MKKQATISLKDIKPFKETIDLLKNILSDDRIPEELRIEYKNKCSELLNIKNIENDKSDLSRRIGIIDVSYDLIRDNPEGMIEAFRDILVTDVKFDTYEILHYRGLSKHFDIVSEGEKPPRYNILCIRKHSDGRENRTYKYEKVKE